MYRKKNREKQVEEVQISLEALVALYLRVLELQKKCADRPVANWSLVRNQLLLNECLAALFDQFDR